MYYSFQYMMHVDVSNDDISCIKSYFLRVESYNLMKTSPTRGGKQTESTLTKSQPRNIKHLMSKKISKRKDDKGVYVPEEGTSQVDSLIALTSIVDKWHEKNDNAAHTSRGQSLHLYHEFSKKTLQCVQMMKYAKQDQIQTLTDILHNIINFFQPSTNGTPTLEEISDAFEQIKTDIITAFVIPLTIQKDVDKTAFESAFKIVIEHLILRYDSPPPKKYWNLVNKALVHHVWENVKNVKAPSSEQDQLPIEFTKKYLTWTSLDP